MQYNNAKLNISLVDRLRKETVNYTKIYNICGKKSM